MPSACTSCRHLGNAWACVRNTRASLHTIAAKPSFISTAHGLWRAMRHVSAPEPTSEAAAVRSQRACVSAGPLLSGEVGSTVEGHMVVPDPSWMARQGPEPLGTWQCPSPPRWRGVVQSPGHVAPSEPSLSWEAGFGAEVADGSAWTHALPFILARSMYMRVPSLQGTDSGP
jgi:hypothetical protein